MFVCVDRGLPHLTHIIFKFHIIFRIFSVPKFCFNWDIVIRLFWQNMRIKQKVQKINTKACNSFCKSLVSPKAKIGLNVIIVQYLLYISKYDKKYAYTISINIIQRKYTNLATFKIVVDVKKGLNLNSAHFYGTT